MVHDLLACDTHKSTEGSVHQRLASTRDEGHHTVDTVSRQCFGKICRGPRLWIIWKQEQTWQDVRELLVAHSPDQRNEKGGLREVQWLVQVLQLVEVRGWSRLTSPVSPDLGLSFQSSKFWETFKSCAIATGYLANTFSAGAGILLPFTAVSLIEEFSTNFSLVISTLRCVNLCHCDCEHKKDGLTSDYRK